MHLPKFHPSHSDPFGNYHTAHFTYNDGPIVYPPLLPMTQPTITNHKPAFMIALENANGVARMFLWILVLIDIAVDCIIVATIVKNFTSMMDLSCFNTAQIVALSLSLVSQFFSIVISSAGTITCVVVFMCSLVCDLGDSNDTSMIPTIRIWMSVALVPLRLLTLIICIVVLQVLTTCQDEILRTLFVILSSIIPIYIIYLISMIIWIKNTTQ